MQIPPIAPIDTGETFRRLNAVIRDGRKITPAELARTERTISSSLTRAFAQIREALRPFVKALETAARTMVRWANSIREKANDEVRVSGLEARYYVRAGADPTYAHPERRDALVRDLLAGEVEDDPLLVFVTPENRRRLAVAALRGWALHRSPEPASYVAHRLWGRTAVAVSCG